jgi:hypothetical protein
VTITVTAEPVDQVASVLTNVVSFDQGGDAGVANPSGLLLERQRWSEAMSPQRLKFFTWLKFFRLTVKGNATLIQSLGPLGVDIRVAR